MNEQINEWGRQAQPLPSGSIQDEQVVMGSLSYREPATWHHRTAQRSQGIKQKKNGEPVSRDMLRASNGTQIVAVANRAHVPARCITLPAVVSLLGPCKACRKVDSLQSIPCSLMQEATLSHPQYYPHISLQHEIFPITRLRGVTRAIIFKLPTWKQEVRQTIPWMFFGESTPVPLRNCSKWSPGLI